MIDKLVKKIKETKAPIVSLPHSLTIAPTSSYNGLPSIRRSWNSPDEGRYIRETTGSSAGA